MPEDSKEDPKLAQFRWLADRAFLRFTNRRAVEWKLLFGVWTALAAAAALLMRSDVPKITCRAAVVGTVMMVALLVAVRAWLNWLHNANAADQKRSYYWESAVEYSVGHLTPPSLRPGKGNPGTWVRFDPEKVPTVTDGGYSRGPVIGQMLITLILALWLTVTIWERSEYRLGIIYLTNPWGPCDTLRHEHDGHPEDAAGSHPVLLGP